MNIVEIVGLNGPEGAESGKKELKFVQEANFKLEILPSIFKAKEFSGSEIVWLETGVDYRRGHGSGFVEKPVRIPVRICSSGFSDDIAENVRYAFMDCGCLVSLSDGKTYRITLKTNVKADGTAEDSDNDANEGRTETRPGNSCLMATPVKEGQVARALYEFAEVPAGDEITPSKLSDRL